MTYPTYPSFTDPHAALEHYQLEERAGFKLAPLQLADLEKSAIWERWKWFYDVGVGKTICSTVQALMGGHHCHLIIVPPILIPQWGAWLRTIDPNGGVLEYRGPPEVRKQLQLRGPRWIIMSFNIFRDDFSKRILKELGPERPHIIVDEAHNLKNSGSILFKRVNMLATEKLQLLTGTPTSKPTDAYAYIKLVTPQIYRSLGHFEALHVADRDFFGTITEYAGLDLVQQNLMIQASQRTKDEMFPGIVKPRYQVIPYDLSDKHMALYKELAEQQLLLLDNGEKIDATSATRLYHALQQIIVNLDYYTGDEDARSTGFDLIDQAIDETRCLYHSESKLIIWTYYKRTSRLVLSYLRDCHAVGAYSEVDSNKSIKQFMEDVNTRILVAQPGSAGMGLNPQAICWENLFLEHSTVPLQFIQSAGRTDRMGQKHMPTMRIAVARDTIQVPLHHRLLHNGDLVQQTEGSVESIRQAIYGRTQ